MAKPWNLPVSDLSPAIVALPHNPYTLRLCAQPGVPDDLHLGLHPIDAMNAAETAILSLRKLPVVLAIAAVLSGCGQMGPLYLPEQAPPEGESAEVQAEGTVPTEESITPVGGDNSNP